MSEMPIASDFSGAIPRNYDEYLGPMFFEPYASDIADRIDPAAKHVLELGCGTGRVTHHLRKILSASSSLVASDISPDMLAVAREKLKHLDIDWKIIDAQELPFENNSVDLIVCYFGYMFVPDREKAFAEAFRILKKNGSLLMATWDKLECNEASHVFRKTVKKYFGDALPESYKLPFSMHDADAIEKLLRQAGFSKISSERVEKKSYCETAAKAAHALTRGGRLYNEILQRNPAWLDEITISVQKELGELYGNAPMVASMTAIVAQASK